MSRRCETVTANNLWNGLRDCCELFELGKGSGLGARLTLGGEGVRVEGE